ENCIPPKANAEKRLGRKIAEKYDVKAYPTFLVVDTMGQVLSVEVGSLDKASLLDFISQALSVENTFEQVEEDYKQGNRDYYFISYYLKILSDREQYEKSNKILKRYLKGKDWTKDENLDLIFHYGMGEQNLNYLKFFSENETLFQQRFHPIDIEQKIFSFSLALLAFHSYSQIELRRHMERLWPFTAEKRFLYFAIGFKTFYSEEDDDPKEFINELEQYVFRYQGVDRNLILDALNKFIFLSEDMLTLEKINRILNYLEEEEHTVEIFDLQALVFYKMGKIEMCISCIREARKLAFSNGQNYTSMVKMLRSAEKKLNQK
ncbi:MAG: hypothetical protein GY705_17785, partial [Bacteroidetes bacterium]|nr:hypothetical protein [Bacteroidota bacterium]